MTQKDQVQVSGDDPSGSLDDYPPPSPSTLAAMQTAQLDPPSDSGSDMLHNMDYDEARPDPLISPTKRARKSHSPEDTAALMSTRLRPSIKTTPHAPKAMKMAHERRALQQVAPPAILASSPTPVHNEVNDTTSDDIDPFSSPRITSDNIVPFSSPRRTPGLESQMGIMAPPPSPFILPSGATPIFEQPTTYPDPTLWDRVVTESARSASGASDQQWPQEPPGIPSRQGPPAPMYATKPVAGHEMQMYQYSMREPQPATYTNVAPLPSLFPFTAPQQQFDYPPSQYGPSKFTSYGGSPLSSQTYLPQPPSPMYPGSQSSVLPSAYMSESNPLLLSSDPMQVNLIPPTPRPLEKGKGRAIHEATQVSMLPVDDRLKSQSSSFPTSSLHSSPTPFSPMPSQMGINDTRSGPALQPANTVSDPSSQLSGVVSSISHKSKSGRLKDATKADAEHTFEQMDTLLRAFSIKHSVSFDRALRGYTNRHNIRTSGDNAWVIYTKLHKHEDYIQRELDRIGCTLAHFKTLNGATQQQLRAKCYQESEKTFDSTNDCHAALQLFKELWGTEEKAQGTTLARLQRAFNSYVKKVEKIGQLANLKEGFQFLFALSGIHIHSDQALVDLRMSKGMEGFMEEYCRASPGKMMGYMKTWCLQQSNTILLHDWEDKLPGEAGPSSALQVQRSKPVSSPSSSSSSSPSPSPSPVRNLPKSLHEVVPKLATQARKLFLKGLFAAGARLGDSRNMPWHTLARVAAADGIQMFNWLPDCPFPEETSGIKGIENASIGAIRAILAQFNAKDLPLSFRRCQSEEERQALLDSSRPVIVSIPFDKPQQHRLLFLDKTIETEPIASKTKRLHAAALDPIPSSELTPIEESYWYQVADDHRIQSTRARIEREITGAIQAAPARKSGMVIDSRVNTTGMFTHQ
ncbi:hypothetical protein HWV62_25999 [Athelia sp. TMB]|nr:hypothetical protein HWV62_25999 [Athelia sp. TMB]